MSFCGSPVRPAMWHKKVLQKKNEYICFLIKQAEQLHTKRQIGEKNNNFRKLFHF